MQDQYTPRRMNNAHIAMWVVAIFLIVVGVAVVIIGSMAIQSIDLLHLATATTGIAVGSAAASTGLLLLIIAWTISAARR